MRSAGGRGRTRCCLASRSAEVQEGGDRHSRSGELDRRGGGAPSPGSGGAVTHDQLFLCPGARGEWRSCPPDEVTWLDRSLLSGNEDLTLHRAPRCAGLRYVHHRWELFSRDSTHRVYLTPDPGGETLPAAPAVQRAARSVVPAAPGHHEALPAGLHD